MPAFERNQERLKPCSLASATTSPFLCSRRSRCRRRSRPPRGPPLPPDDAQDEAESIGALPVLSRGRNQPPRAAPPWSSRRRQAAGESELTPSANHLISDPWVTDQWAQWLN